MSGLREAYELIKDESRWCHGQMATDAFGFNIQADHPGARRWCASGAVVKCHVNKRENAALIAAAKQLFPASRISSGEFGPVVAVNDKLGHEAVVQVFEKALVEVEGSL